jgi:hypothetical protein
VIDSLRVEVEETVEAMLGKTWFLSQPTPARMEKWRQSAQEKAIVAAGFSYQAYGHLKVAGVVDDIVATARRAWPEGSAEHFHDLRAAIWAEMRTRRLDHVAKANGKGASKESIDFFRHHDLHGAASVGGGRECQRHARRCRRNHA